MAAFFQAMNGAPVTNNAGYGIIPTEFTVRLSDIVAKLYHFHDFKQTLNIASLKESFDKKLYSTYLSYLPQEQWKQALDIKTDERGYFSELLKSDFSGQISVSRTKPGVVRGNHWHHTKTEKFIVIEGNARIRFRMIGGTDIIQYQVSGERPELIEVPPGYTHSLENSGTTDMIALIWCNEQFMKEKPDTYNEEV